MKFYNIFWNFLRSSFCECTIHALLFDSLLCYSRKVSSFQFHWTKTIAYRVICNEMFVVDFWFMLACLDSVEMFEWFVSRSLWSCLHVKIWRDVLFVRNWRMSRCFDFCYARILTKCFVCLQLMHDSWLDYRYVSMRTRCFCNWFVFRFRLVALHVKIYINFEKMSLQTIYFFQFLTSVDMLKFWIVFAC